MSHRPSDSGAFNCRSWLPVGDGLRSFATAQLNGLRKRVGSRAAAQESGTNKHFRNNAKGLNEKKWLPR
jgi:hypothetical protein